MLSCGLVRLALAHLLVLVVCLSLGLYKSEGLESYINTTYTHHGTSLPVTLSYILKLKGKQVISGAGKDLYRPRMQHEQVQWFSILFIRPQNVLRLNIGQETSSWRNTEFLLTCFPSHRLQVGWSRLTSLTPPEGKYNTPAGPSTVRDGNVNTGK